MKTIKYVLLSVFSCAILVGCGEKEEKKKEGFSYENKTKETKKVVEEDISKVVLTSNDLMQYNKTEIKVKAGKKVKLTLRHIGKLDKKVMGHNFVLLKQGVSVSEFGNKAATFANNEYIPNDTQDLIAHTKLIGAGETAVIEFDAPKPGEYDFLCSFPGHYAIMKGKFIVE
ncbi:azurin [Sabulilitoribacter arenilitoris]|uniref:Azurin n=1 Tax=Wocania arenilitoris TaxID=2044858 RepID=A0AAE3EQ43_9FLAO|nr:azurin [Wocania arenilitoris]MCF7568992.1 azurin [Wocania arenilitoris]